MSEIICLHCHGLIYDDDALLCHFCGKSLGRVTQGGVLGQMRRGPWAWVFGGIVLALALVTMMTMFM